MCLLISLKKEGIRRIDASKVSSFFKSNKYSLFSKALNSRIKALGFTMDKTKENNCQLISWKRTYSRNQNFVGKFIFKEKLLK